MVCVLTHNSTQSDNNLDCGQPYGEYSLRGGYRVQSSDHSCCFVQLLTSPLLHSDTERFALMFDFGDTFPNPLDIQEHIQSVTGK